MLACGPAMSSSAQRFDPGAVLHFWKQAGPKMWFTKDDDFDRRFRETFLEAHEAATRGELDAWLDAPDSALALVLLLDQFPRNSFRGTPRMFASDALARAKTDIAIQRGHDRAVDPQLRFFFYLPFGHSENLADQERGCSLGEDLNPEILKFAHGHRDIIQRFGRFPHRNAVLDRTSTAEELAFLAEGGFSG
jgi:uncharacterized protein (DUF924 family)